MSSNVVCFGDDKCKVRVNVYLSKRLRVLALKKRINLSATLEKCLEEAVL